MNNVVDLAGWRHDHERPNRRAAATASGEPLLPANERLDRLDLAVERLSELVNRALKRTGALEPKVETELLAIMGEVTMGLVIDATSRAERLAGLLSARFGTS